MSTQPDAQTNRGEVPPDATREENRVSDVAANDKPSVCISIAELADRVAPIVESIAPERVVAHRDTAMGGFWATHYASAPTDTRVTRLEAQVADMKHQIERLRRGPELRDAPSADADTDNPQMQLRSNDLRIRSI